MPLPPWWRPGRPPWVRWPSRPISYRGCRTGRSRPPPSTAHRCCRALRPEALLLEGADPALGAAACFRLAQEGGVVGDAQPADRAQDVARSVLGSPVVAQGDLARHVGAQATEAVDDRVINRLQGGKAIAELSHLRPGLGCVVSTQATPTPNRRPGSRHRRIRAPAQVGRLGNDPAVMGSGLATSGSFSYRCPTMLFLPSASRSRIGGLRQERKCGARSEHLTERQVST
jgi:hypothetical protein